MNKSSRLYETALSVSRTERVALLLDALRTWVAELSGKSKAEIAPTATVSSLNSTWQDIDAWARSLAPYVEKELALMPDQATLKDKNTLAGLAEYFADALTDAILPFTYSDPYAGGLWGWDTPAPYAATTDKKPTVFFVLGVPRSGTTLLRTMLAGHPSLFSPPELWLLPFDTLGEFRMKLNKMRVGALQLGLEQAFANLEQLTAEDAHRRVNQLAAQDVPIPTIYQMLQERAGNRIVVDKTPTYIAHIGWLRRAEQMFAEPKYLHLVRHPCGMMESHVRLRAHRFLKNNLGVWDENGWLLAEKIWATWNWNALEFLRNVPPERQYCLRYEDLVTNPQLILQDICRFFEVPFDKAVLDPYSGQRMMDGIGDPNLRLRNHVDGTLAEAWRTKPFPSQLSDFTMKVAAHFDYAMPATG